jgi:hypothetical protein
MAKGRFASYVIGERPASHRDGARSPEGNSPGALGLRMEPPERPVMPPRTGRSPVCGLAAQPP